MEDALERDRVQGHDLGRRFHDDQCRLDLAGAWPVATVANDDQLWAQAGQRGRIQGAWPQFIAGAGEQRRVLDSARATGATGRPSHHRGPLYLGRVVAAMADAYELIAKPQRADDLGRGSRQAGTRRVRVGQCLVPDPKACSG